MYSLLLKAMLLTSLVAPASQFTGQLVQTKQGANCDFSSYNPLILSHPLVSAASRTIDPVYPEIARQAKVQGTVEVRILVNRDGEVMDACIVEGPPLLHSAARNAALQWKFKKNFGLTHKQRRRFVESSIAFKFSLDGESGR
ncbi:MAG TPA: energy transducer TonB [Pyrinomonadaceae bacterium]|jgi:TonB family protein|nr:energy transducer TonB [Pyrinomonadaceae bacterium]